ncbi:MAG TPA: efflux RND transporter periplasmic adaptor subunit [Planctomycetota bacterium]|jgi:cobalt-zinc-cadmium efflux system membrane fusion protein|nr:efflux RND transporter periplasmic adaptor subunit [Planctomycetota bacterium]
MSGKNLLLVTGVLPGVLLAAAGCSRSDKDGTPASKPTPKTSPPEPATPESAPSGRTVLEIDSDTLRDLRITTVHIEKHAHAESVEGLAEVRVDETAYAEVTCPLEARIVKLRAAPGDRVEVGAVLADMQSVELGRARATVIGARKRFEIARETAERLKGLAESRIATQRELLEAQASLAQSEAEFRSAEASLQALGCPSGNSDRTEDLSLFPLATPIAGTVLDRQAVLGQVARADRPLFRIADLRRVWLVIQVFERDASRLSVGSDVRVRFVALPGREFVGRLEFLGTQVDPVARIVHVRAVLPNEDGLLRPGMAATAWASLGAEQVLSVPASAIQRLEENWCVFVPRGEGRFEMRRVARGRDLGGEVEILQGLESGEEVVVQGSFVLKAQAEKAHGGGEHEHH